MFSTSSTITGSWLEKAAYLTYQFPLLGGTVLAGLRLEGRNYDIAVAPPARAPRETHAFPSLHLERTITRWLSADLSYSRRIAWPGITDLDPALRFSDPTTAVAGSPVLRPEITDSLEAKLQFRLSRQSVDLTVYSRTTHDRWSDFSELNGDGVLVTQTRNLGTLTLNGASLSVRGPLGGGFRYTLTAIWPTRMSGWRASIPISSASAPNMAARRSSNIATGRTGGAAPTGS